MINQRQLFAITNLLKVCSVLAAEMGMLKAIHVSLYPLKRQYGYQRNLLAVWLQTSQSLGTFSPLGKVLKITGKERSEESCRKVGGFCGGPIKTIEALSAGVNCLHVEGSLLGRTSSSLWLCSLRVNSCVAGPLYYILLDIAVMLVGGRLAYSTVSTDAL